MSVKSDYILTRNGVNSYLFTDTEVTPLCIQCICCVQVLDQNLNNIMNPQSTYPQDEREDFREWKDIQLYNEARASNKPRERKPMEGKEYLLRHAWVHECHVHCGTKHTGKLLYEIPSEGFINACLISLDATHLTTGLEVDDVNSVAPM